MDGRVNSDSCHVDLLVAYLQKAHRSCPFERAGFRHEPSAQRMEMANPEKNHFKSGMEQGAPA